MKTIAVLFANFGPYHIARVRALAAASGDSDNFRIIGIELARTEDEYPWRADVTGLPFELHSVTTENSLRKHFSLRILLGLSTTLDNLQPDVIAISGYASIAMLLALRWCVKNRRIPILMSETSEHDFDRCWIKERFKRWIIGSYRSALVGGQPQKRYLVKLGMSPDAIFTGYDVVDNDIFNPAHIAVLPRPLERPYFLSINRFIPKKNLSTVLKAYAEYRQTASNPWDLVLCGDGKLRSELESQIAAAALESSVHITGFLQQKDILPYLAHAQCFIHASTQEQWGLVVNEAMAAGLPVILSNRCGCFEDLLVEGVNGFGFDPLDQAELTRLMIRVCDPKTDLAAMGKAAHKHISSFSPDTFAKGLLKAASLT